jgi:hypothetical protein
MRAIDSGSSVEGSPTRAEVLDMKYVITWNNRPSAIEGTAARSLQVFAKWQPASNFREFLGRIDGQGGFAVVESDDPATIAKDIGPFVGFFDFVVYPVREIADTAATGAEAVAFLQSIE